MVFSTGAFWAVVTALAIYNGALIGDTVWNNAIQYVTPRTGGFAGNVIYGLGEVAGSSETANLGLHANYLKGNFSAAFSAPSPTSRQCWGSRSSTARAIEIGFG